MKNSFHIVFLIFVFGVLFAPKYSLACEKMNGNSEKACCKKSKAFETLKKDCCSKKNSSHCNHSTKQKNKTKKGCGDDCDQTCFQCAPNNFCFTIPVLENLPNKIFIAEPKEQKIAYIETFLSKGFLSIFLPPKLV